MSTQPTPEAVKFLSDFLLQHIRDEHATTATVLQAVHPGDWRPDPKSKTALELVWHLASSERWFLHAIATLDFQGGEKPKQPATIGDIIEFYENGFADALAALEQLTGPQLLEEVDFYGSSVPRYALLNLVQVHSVHHRGQLATYLRPLGGKVPAIYGGSADTK